MALSTFVKHYEDIKVTFKDGTAVTPLSCVCNLDQGDISVQNIKKILREVVKYERKGKLQSVRHGKRIYPSGSFTMQFAEFSETTSGTLYDFLHGSAGTPYAARKSTIQGGVAKAVFTCDITIDCEGTDYNDVDSDITFEDCDVTWEWSVGEPATCKISFEVLGAITGDVAAAEA
jgi:hypothetical protein